MISFVRGKVICVNANSVILECFGLGYEVFSTSTDLAKLYGMKDAEAALFTQLVHREDSMTLYGFLSEKTKQGFIALQKVSGIGPKLALKILSSYDESALFTAVENEDISFLQAIPGIGPKMAKKIIFDLKGTIINSNNNIPVIERDLISALVNLGFRENEVVLKLKEIKPLDDDFEINFKKLLKILSGK